MGAPAAVAVAGHFAFNFVNQRVNSTGCWLMVGRLQLLWLVRFSELFGD